MSPTIPKPAERVILLGLDGATYRLIKPWSKEGILPNFAELFQDSAWGELDSTIPPTTPPAWSACLTGKNPGKHGIYDFRESPLKHPQRPLVNLSSMQGRKLWHFFNAAGKKAAIINVPITFPPEPLDGIMLSGLMTPSDESDYAYPAELKPELIKAIGDYVVNIDIPKYDVELEADALRFLDDIDYSFQKRKEAFFWLMENKPWHFFMIVFINMDRIQHLFWKYLDPQWKVYESRIARKLRPRIINCYRMVDDMLGELRPKLGDTPLIIMSDHGFGSTRQWFNVNTWLMKEGYLKVKSDALLKKQIFTFFMDLNDSQLVKTLVPKALQSAIRQRVRGTRSTFKSDLEAALDYSNTKAFFASIPSQGIFINIKRDGIGVVSPGAEYDQLRDEIRVKLEKLVDPQTGKPVVDRVYFREEIYKGEQTQFAPDILFKAQNYGCLGRQLIGPRKNLQTSANTPNGFHRPEGIFMALGPQFKAGVEIKGAEIQDIAPTILNLTGQAIPDDMDGKVLKDSFVDEFASAHPATFVQASDFAESQKKDFSDKESDEIAGRLRSLGYLE
ncbi:MAG: alkaline phosphatase family protein [bacterium]|nr:alkaline phosphatase family protein [bacterium]